MPSIKCPRCGNKKSWMVRRNKRKCTVCKYEWPRKKLPLQISPSQWRHLIEYCLEFETVNAVVSKTKLGRGQVLRAFGIIRTVISRDQPDELTSIDSGSQLPEKVYIGCFDRDHLRNRQIFGSSNPIVCLNGVYALGYRNGKIWGRLLSGQTAKDLENMMNESAYKIIPWSSILDKYTGVITKTGFYYFNYKEKKRADISHMDCFSIWSGLKQLIAAKHGIRKEGLPLYLGEVIWISNFKELEAISQRKRILSLIVAKGYKKGANH